MAELSEQDKLLDAIRDAGQKLGRPPSRREFMAASGITEYQVLRHYPSWREAVRAAGLEPHGTNAPLEPHTLLEDWGEMVRRLRRIPTRSLYRKEGTFSPQVFEKRIGPWSSIPKKFRHFAANIPEWADVLALLPLENARVFNSNPIVEAPQRASVSPASSGSPRYPKLEGRPTYGDPLDFRGLRHEPVNESGVVFLFGMVARELGFLVEAVQAGYPDCEAKRQIDVGKWQRVRIEFEFESRNFRDHGHPPDGCDVIVCWRHNWLECPPHLQVVELRTILTGLAASED